MEILLILTSLIALVLATTQCSDSATATSAQDAAAVTNAPNFRLVANVSRNDLNPSIQGWVVSSYHISPCWDYATLEHPGAGDSDYSRAFYLSGTKAAARRGNADVLTDGATPPTPYGLVIPATNETDDEGRRAVQIMCGMRTPEVSISGFRRPHLSYHDEDDPFGLWYACNKTLPYGPAIVLYFRGSQPLTPSNCAELELYPECDGDVSHVDKDAKPGRCYPSVVEMVGDKTGDS